MRTFKIFIITILLLALAGGALFGIKALIPASVGPGEDEFSEIYNEDPLAEEDIYSENIKQYEGTVKALGISIYKEGTHRLEKDDKLIALLESDKVNLSDFEEKEVKVTGVVRDTTEGGQQVMEVRFLEQVKEAGVKVFSEAGYEFSFSYPGEWETKKEKDKVTFFVSKGDTEENVMIVFQYPDREGSFEQWIGERDQNLFFEEKQVRVGDQNGVRRTISNGDQEIIKTYTSAGTFAYELRLISQEEVMRNQYFSIVDYFRTAFVDVMSGDKGEEEVMEKEEEKTPEEVITEDPKGALIESPLRSPDETGTAEAKVSNSEVFSDLTPLDEDEVQVVTNKGYAPFDGRTLSFQYPKVWYFSYLGDGVYGFTDDESYKANENEVTTDISRMLILSGTVDIPCTATVQKKVEEVTYTVCTREPGLEGIAKSVAESISGPVEQ